MYELRIDRHEYREQSCLRYFRSLLKNTYLYQVLPACKQRYLVLSANTIEYFIMNVLILAYI